MELTWRQLAPYVMEVRDLVGTLLTRLAEIDGASASWIGNVESADLQLEDQPENDRADFARTLQAQVRDQTQLFDLLEAFLAAWARLSLLLFPTSSQGADAEFRIARGECLRRVLGVGVDCVFCDRDLRDAWMHFDERLDAAVLGKTFGNRHSFVRSERVRDYVDIALRLMEVDTMIVHYRNRDGKPRSVDLKQLRNKLLELGAAAQDRNAQNRLGVSDGRTRQGNVEL